MSEMAEAIRELVQEKGVPLESVKQTIENTLKAAYKKTFGTADNCIVVFADDLSDVNVASRKTVVDGVYDPVTEIELEDALKLSSECELGDEIDIIIDPKDFERSAVSIGKQETHKGLNESFKDNLYNEFKDKVGEIIIGYFQREYNGNIFVDLGKVEGYLPAKNQSPREHYEKNDRIKAYITDIKKIPSGIQLVLSRSDPRFVQAILELEVPELQDKTVTIKKVVRDAGYRTKIAVASAKPDVDPVGACVGMKGMRIQNVITELEGEKIDVIRWNEDPRIFIKNALAPAEVLNVYILDEDKKQALAVVEDSQLSLAIGKLGQNVRLANRLCDWSIDVKTEAQAADIDLAEIASRAAHALFNDNAQPLSDMADVNYDEITSVARLPGVNAEVAAVLKEAGFDDIEKFASAYENGELKNIENVSAEDLKAVNDIISSTFEFVDEDEGAAEGDNAETSEETEEEEYFCPECGAKITLDMTKCPNCGVEFEFEEDEE